MQDFNHIPKKECPCARPIETNRFASVKKT